MNLSDVCREEIISYIHSICPFKLNNHGKMIRSEIGLLILNSIGYEIKKDDLKFLSVIELIHTSSLLHDDVIDGCEIRRNSSLNNKLAVLYGDIILININEILNEFNNSELIKLFNKTVKTMCEGEISQIKSESEIPSIEDYIKKTQMKTSSLFEFMVKGLFIIREENIIQELVSFAKNYGTAFQLKNDFVDVMTSKSDIKNGIYTASVIFSGGINITEDSIEKTKGLIDNYINEALKCLDVLEESSYKKTLTEVTKCLKG